MCVLVQEDLKVVDPTTTQQQQQDYRSSPPTPDEVQWSYTDPQGKIQGKSALSRNKKFNPKDIKKREGFCDIKL